MVKKVIDYDATIRNFFQSVEKYIERCIMEFEYEPVTMQVLYKNFKNEFYIPADTSGLARYHFQNKVQGYTWADLFVDKNGRHLNMVDIAWKNVLRSIDAYYWSKNQGLFMAKVEQNLVDNIKKWRFTKARGFIENFIRTPDKNIIAYVQGSQNQK